MRLSNRVEIVEFTPWPDRTGYRRVQVAIDGRLSWPFDLHESDYAEMLPDQFESYLITAGETLLQRYGDARKVRLQENGELVSLEI